MPYEWDIDSDQAPASTGAFSHADGNAPQARLYLWPYRSLLKRDFVRVLGVAFLAFLLPVLAFIGSAMLWGLLVPTMGTLWLLWFFIQKSYRDGEILEELNLWSDHITLTRTGPKGRVQEWQANRYWVTLQMYERGGPVDNYLTLKGGDRTVELGAFLTPKERATLCRALRKFIR